MNFGKRGKGPFMTDVDEMLLLGGQESADWPRGWPPRRLRLAPEPGGEPDAGVVLDTAGETLWGVLQQLRCEGFTAEFGIDDDGLLCCRICGVCTGPRAGHVRALRLVNQASGRHVVRVVLALGCQACASRGTAVIKCDGVTMPASPQEEATTTIDRSSS